jgi:hypothetical protein
MQRDFLPANLRIPKQGRHTENLPEQPLHSFGLQLLLMVSVSVFPSTKIRLRSDLTHGLSFI